LIIDQVTKESSCHDPKMATYYQVVCLLEDKFNGLKLNHATRRSNEAADELAKLASGRALVPTGVFASDLYKLSVTYQGSVYDGSEPPKPALGAGSTPAPLTRRLCKSRRTQTYGPTPTRLENLVP
jgi:hypothetical protein